MNLHQQIMREFDEKFGKDPKNSPILFPFVPELKSFLLSSFLRIEEAVEKEFRECVPENKSKSQFVREITHADVSLANIQARAMEVGWNTCRAGILHRLDERKDYKI